MRRADAAIVSNRKANWVSGHRAAIGTLFAATCATATVSERALDTASTPTSAAAFRNEPKRGRIGTSIALVALIRQTSDSDNNGVVTLCDRQERSTPQP